MAWLDPGLCCVHSTLGTLHCTTLVFHRQTTVQHDTLGGCWRRTIGWTRLLSRQRSLRGGKGVRQRREAGRAPIPALWGSTGRKAQRQAPHPGHDQTREAICTCMFVASYRPRKSNSNKTLDALVVRFHIDSLAPQPSRCLFPHSDNGKQKCIWSLYTKSSFSSPMIRKTFL